jgi:hypothetical protein
METLYVAAGEKGWGTVPVYNAIVLMKIIGPPTVDYFTIYSIINLIMFPIWVETLKLWKTF